MTVQKNIKKHVADGQSACAGDKKTSLMFPSANIFNETNGKVTLIDFVVSFFSI